MCGDLGGSEGEGRVLGMRGGAGLEKEEGDPPLAETGVDDVEAISLADILGLGQGKRLRNF